MEMEKTIKNIILAGIGTAAFAYEKAMETVEDMVKRGELTVEQGKALTGELKTKLTKKDGVQSEITFNATTLNEILTQGNIATKKDIEELKERIEALEKLVK
ncbi:phasin family protein [Anaerobranca gottschalkii]|uniref:Polyhydroxyalkanoate synthesis regulator phasin n=1 Tax=Anaerobranca gottschalkii DSM 13577 TaxID=1120990 RepID=A0A1I0AAM6_9FIRM|nr:hypothetical protein [Anaerobranca gottschalkii]SES91246.1 Polyhydroxyalkanoate synthesis regulator phasin [Anaerobranca gottschalkii DSM 13577]